MRVRHRLRRTGLAVICLASSIGAATLLASPASAATTNVNVTAGHHRAVASTAVPKITKVVQLAPAIRTAAAGGASAKVGPAAPPASISCSLNYTAPYVIDPGGLDLIAANAFLLCNYPVDEMDIGDLITWNYVNTIAYDGESHVLATAVSAAPLDQCVSGVYQATVNVRIIYPPGFSPPSAEGTYTTPPSWYDC